MPKNTSITLPPALAMLLRMLAQREAERRIRMAIKPFKKNDIHPNEPPDRQTH